MRKTALLLLIGLGFAPAAPALAHHNHHLVTSCDSYRVVKRYVPARFNRHGALVGGYWKTKRKCAHPTRTLLVNTPITSTFIAPTSTTTTLQHLSSGLHRQLSSNRSLKHQLPNARASWHEWVSVVFWEVLLVATPWEAGSPTRRS